MDTNSEAALRKRPLSLNTRRSAAAVRERKGGEEPAGMEMMMEEPVSPTGRLFREPHFNCYIMAVIGSGTPIDLAATRAGLEATIARHPRFCSVQFVDRWRKFRLCR